MALAVLMGATAPDDVNAMCESFLSQSCNVRQGSPVPTVELPSTGPGSPGGGILPDIFPTPLPPGSLPTPIPNPSGPTTGDEEPGLGSVTVTPGSLTFEARRFSPEGVLISEGTTIGSIQTLTIAASEAPIGGNLVLRVRSSGSSVGFFNPADELVAQEITVTIPEGFNVTRTVFVSRQIGATLSANPVITVSIDEATNADNYRVGNEPGGRVVGNVLVNVRAGLDIPSDEPTDTILFAVDQITMTAEVFRLTQTQTTGIVGYGKVTGSGRLEASYGSSAIVPNTLGFPPDSVPAGCRGVFTEAVRDPFFVLDPLSGTGIFALTDQDVTFEEPGTIREGALRRSPITIAGQRLTFGNRRRDGVLFANISPANFDQIYRINYFEDNTFDVRRAVCRRTETPVLDDDGLPVLNPVTGLPQVTEESFLELLTSTPILRQLLPPTERLFTLRGTEGGIDEPDGGTGNGTLFGPQILSDRPTEPITSRSLLDLDDPRFSGVQNQLDVSSNQLRTDITFVFDQIRNQPTQAAERDQPPFIPAPVFMPGVDSNGNFSPIFDPATQAIPNTNVSGLLGRGTPTCPNVPDIACGRFQFNQPFRETEASDVLLIQGTFFGRIIEFVTLQLGVESVLFPEGSGTGAVQTVVITPGAPPTGGNLVVDLSVNTDLITVAPTTLTFPAGSVAPQTITITRQAEAGSLGNSVISIVKNQLQSTASNATEANINTTLRVRLE